MNDRIALSFPFVLLSTVVLVACGAGGDGSFATPRAVAVASPEPTPSRRPPPRDFNLSAAFGGTLVGASAQDLIVVVGRDRFWGVYGSGASTDFRPKGLITGTDSRYRTSVARFQSDTGFDWGSGLSARIDLALDTSIPSMSGSVASSAGTQSVSGGVLAAAAYDRNAGGLGAIVGHWELTTSEGRSLSIDIDANGTVTASSGTCRFNNSAPLVSAVRPSKSRKNVFAISLVIDGCNSSFAGRDGVHGFAVAYALSGGGTQLVIGAENAWDPVYLAAAGKR
jgi:hypothetical protein